MYIINDTTLMGETLHEEGEDIITTNMSLPFSNNQDSNNNNNNNETMALLRDLQQTSVQEFMNSYGTGTGFNDTTAVGLSGLTPSGRPAGLVAPMYIPSTAVGTPGTGVTTGVTGVGGFPGGAITSPTGGIAVGGVGGF